MTFRAEMLLAEEEATILIGLGLVTDSREVTEAMSKGSFTDLGIVSPRSGIAKSFLRVAGGGAGLTAVKDAGGETGWDKADAVGGMAPVAGIDGAGGCIS